MINAFLKLISSALTKHYNYIYISPLIYHILNCEYIGGMNQFKVSKYSMRQYESQGQRTCTSTRCLHTHTLTHKQPLHSVRHRLSLVNSHVRHRFPA